MAAVAGSARVRKHLSNTACFVFRVSCFPSTALRAGVFGWRVAVWCAHLRYGAAGFSDSQGFRLLAFGSDRRRSWSGVRRRLTENASDDGVSAWVPSGRTAVARSSKGIIAGRFQSQGLGAIFIAYRLFGVWGLGFWVRELSCSYDRTIGARA
jgi:hypothetical protein